ncbi:MAG: Ig-like domain-containing protein [Chitinispirillales bacterium]|jgi:uncharacterized protein (DUF2141 family)|nr:Ig-like domain-containing protein [Chitinispirillales bacterium]
MKRKTALSLTAALLAAALLYCANQSPPSGGPVDEAPPKVAASSPSDGQANVDPQAAVSVTFSEWINRSGAAGAVSVYPPLTRGVAVKVAKNKLIIAPREPFAGNTTYHVVIGAALQDLRNNAVARPINIVFSTGAALDSGALDGAIVGLEPKAKLKRVMLFAEEAGGSGGWDDARYFQPPTYAAQSDSIGAFTFARLRTGAYRVVAFADEYKAGRLRVGDSCFAPLERSINVTKSPQFIRLYPAESDTAAAKDSAAADTAKAGVVDTAKAGAVDTAKIHAAKGSVSPDAETDAADAAASKKKAKAADICYRLQGGADCLEPNEKRKWVYSPIGKKERFTVADSAGTFAFDSIPASKGTLMWFIDDNGDGKLTKGKLVPWRAPERFFAVPDTIEAKANWEIEGLRVKGCEK